ncbi:MAG: undecaprenyl-diphosphate phosphatase [Acidimicrobiales bacterium]
MGLIQGISELFPISSLGHTVLIPSWIGGSWATLVSQESSSESPYLAFVVGLHLATALVLLGFYVKEWVRLIAAWFRSVAKRRIETDDERLAWLIVLATIPVGIAGLALEHTFRTLFAKPLAAALFLTANGVILLGGELWVARGRAPRGRGPAHAHAHSRVRIPEVPDAGVREVHGDNQIVPMDEAAEAALAKVGVVSAMLIGASQILALFAGISREGVTMVGGLFRGLSRENAMRFAFLLAAPVILAAGALKVPDLMGHLGNGIRGQVVAGSVAAALTALIAILFLARYFKTRTLKPFAYYSLAFGLASVIRFGFF